MHHQCARELDRHFAQSRTSDSAPYMYHMYTVGYQRFKVTCMSMPKPRPGDGSYAPVSSSDETSTYLTGIPWFADDSSKVKSESSDAGSGDESSVVSASSRNLTRDDETSSSSSSISSSSSHSNDNDVWSGDDGGSVSSDMATDQRDETIRRGKEKRADKLRFVRMGFGSDILASLESFFWR